MTQEPRLKAESITERCEMLLSPGTSNSQFNGKALFIFQSILKRVVNLKKVVIQRAGYRGMLLLH
jgi:hypothetical protein